MADNKGKNWIDFAELKTRIRFEHVLDRLELTAKLERAGDELRGQCPICKRGDEKSKSFSINTSKQVFQCFACKRKGNVLDFTAGVHATDVHHAALWLRDEFVTNSEGQESVPAEASSNGAGKEAVAAEGAEAPMPAREAWLVAVIAQGVAWYLAETFKPLADVGTMEKCIVAKVEIAAGMYEAVAGEGDHVSAEAQG